MNPYQEMIARRWKAASPHSALFELTFVCNHACSFCYNCPTGERELETEQVFEVLRKIADFGVLFLTFSGGEPLCRKDFFAIAAEARRLHFAIRVYTNGYLIDEAVAERLATEARPFEMEISLHGAGPGTHEAMTRVPGSFARLVAAVRALRKRDIKVLLKTPITKRWLRATSAGRRWPGRKSRPARASLSRTSAFATGSAGCSCSTAA